MWWMVAALANGPVWDQDQVFLQPPPRWSHVVVNVPGGTLRFGADGSRSLVEAVDEDGLVTVGPPAWDPTGYLMTPSRPCDVDGDGVDDLVDYGLYVRYRGRGPPQAVLRDAVTGAALLTMAAPPGFDQDDPLVDLVCADVDADGLVEVLGLIATGEVVRWNHDGSLRDVVPMTRAVTPLPRLAVGQLDADPAEEIVLPDRRVVDLGASALETVLQDAVTDVRLSDLDRDGVDERLQLRHGTWEAVDGQGAVRWQTPLDVSALLADDFDRDGVAEVVVSTDDRLLHVLEGADGAPRFPPVAHDRCTGLFRYDPDGDGVYEVYCDSEYRQQVVFDPATGTRRAFLGLGAQNKDPLAGDLDGDGTTEVVWTAGLAPDAQDRIAVAAADGTLLSHLSLADQPHPRTVSLLDLDGDGDVEIVHGAEVWDWAPSTGFVLQRELFPSDRDLGAVLAVLDVNGDGVDDLVVADRDGDPEVLVLDGATGALSQIATYRRGSVLPEVVDLSGDGTPELVYQMPAGTVVSTLDGVALSRIRDEAWAVVPMPWGNMLVTATDAALTLHRWRGGGLQPWQQVTMPAGVDREMIWEGGRLWIEHTPFSADVLADPPVQTIVGWSPYDGSLVDLEQYGMPRSYIAVADGYVWYPNQLNGAFGRVLPEVVVP